MVFLEQLHDRIYHHPEWRAWAAMAGQLSPQDDIKFGCDHGIRHWMHVSRIAADFVRQAGGNQHEICLADIAGLLHDCGLICGDKHHAAHGARIAEAFLRANYGNGRPLSDSDITIICHAIANHSGGAEMNNLVDAAVLFADKIDIDHTRIKQAINHIQHEELKIQRVEYRVADDYLALRYLVDPDFDIDSFMHWRKAYEGPEQVAHFLGKQFMFFLNDDFVDLSAYQNPAT